MTGARWLRALPLAGALLACGAASDEKQPATASAGSGGGASTPGPEPSALCGTSTLGAPRLRRLSRAELTRTLAAVFSEAQPGPQAWSLTFSADPISPHGFDNDAALLVVGNQQAAELDAAGDAVGAAVSGPALPALLPCAASTTDAACARQFIDKYGKRLFRRALTADEAARYVALFEQASAAVDFATGIRYVTRALVQSPHAVYRREVGTESGGVYTLTPQEVATELAYDFTGTAPSDALLAKAEAGQLATPAAREAQARELLLSEPGLRTVERFFDGWLGYGRAASMAKPGVSEFTGLRDAMVGEARRFLGEVVVAQNGGLRELLTAPFTTPTTALAAFYGFPAPASDYAATLRPAGRGIGILAQGALLAAYSGPSASSPTKRGVLVMERLLCRSKPTVPADVPVLSAAEPGNFTTRQHYETIHAKQASCKACHSRFDPIGFGFEHYDQVGRYRDLDGGLPVDSASYLPSADGTAHLFEFQNLEQLAQGLAAQSEPYACATGYVSTYVFGAAEGCLAEGKRAAFGKGEVGFLDYLASLAAEPHFSQRRLP